MESISVTFLGCGDAFGSGGRFQTCVLVESGGTRFLIDCGGRTVVYSGDTEWTDALMEAARDADLFICERCA